MRNYDSLSAGQSQQRSQLPSVTEKTRQIMIFYHLDLAIAEPVNQFDLWQAG